MRIGELAKRAGVSIQAIRFYERRRLMRTPRRTAAGYRQYSAEAVKRVRLIRRALAAAKLAELDRQLNEMAALREHLAHLLGDWDTKLDGVAPGTRAGLLEALGDIQ